MSIDGNTANDLGRTDRMHERLARLLAREIVSGRLSPGETFPPSEELAERYGVSRTVGRETTQALSAAGLVEVRHGRRSVVNTPERWKFLEDLVKQAIGVEEMTGEIATDLFEARAVLEVSVVRLCAERAGDEHLDRLLAQAREMHAYAQQKRNADGDVLARLTEEDQAFHRLIAEGSGNVVLTGIVTDIRRELIPTWALEQLSRREMIAVARAHVRIAEALRARDADGAESLMRKHLAGSVTTTLRRALRPEQTAAVDRRFGAH